MKIKLPWLANFKDTASGVDAQLAASRLYAHLLGAALTAHGPDATAIKHRIERYFLMEVSACDRAWMDEIIKAADHRLAKGHKAKSWANGREERFVVLVQEYLALKPVEAPHESCMRVVQVQFAR